MANTLLRSVLCFCAAVVLLALGVCAVEFGCRTWAVVQTVKSGGPTLGPDEITIPSASSWIDVRPLMDLKYKLSSGETCHIRTNELGVRGPSYAIPKPRGTFRILCLGGTGIFGADMNEDAALPAQLQKQLSQMSGVNVEVINAGCPQSGPLSQVLRYRATLASLQPDLVLMCLSVDDLVYDLDVRGALRVDSSRQPAYAAHPAALTSDVTAVDGVRRDFLSVSWVMDWACGAFISSERQHPLLVPQEGGYGRRELGPIASLSQIASANYSRLIVSTAPSAWGLEQARSAMAHQRPTFGDDLRKVLVELKVSDQVPVYDVLPEFCQNQDSKALFSSRRGCLNTVGHQLYAESLARYLTQTVPELIRRDANSAFPSRN